MLVERGQIRRSITRTLHFVYSGIIIGSFVLAKIVIRICNTLTVTPVSKSNEGPYACTIISATPRYRPLPLKNPRSTLAKSALTN